MKKRTIYSEQSQELHKLFEEAGTNEKVICVPMDYAKKRARCHVLQWAWRYPQKAILR